MHPECSMNCVTGCHGPSDSGHSRTWYFYVTGSVQDTGQDEEKHPSWFELNRKFWQRKGLPKPKPIKVSAPKSEVENKVLRWYGVALCGGQK